MDLHRIVTERMAELGWSHRELIRAGRASGTLPCSERTVRRFVEGEVDVKASTVGPLLDLLNLRLKPGRRPATPPVPKGAIL